MLISTVSTQTVNFLNVKPNVHLLFILFFLNDSPVRAGFLNRNVKGPYLQLCVAVDGISARITELGKTDQNLQKKTSKSLIFLGQSAVSLMSTDPADRARKR
jgi:hypothetical protein